ncbi:Serine/threonine protein kinase KIN1 [Cyberlindnera fabianii]|uniref:non-specific serine/threonine protein kinase n=1 Tax=Cyberlindnera fabianii TaxID=36022 RepID=A0A1V2L9P4_CYBFA|nr:Serine/threonine protein kinase KIN1 [Cyberlindnera fabianii]
MSQDPNRLSEDYHINTNYAQPSQVSQPSQLLPRVRPSAGSISSTSSARKPPTAVPATPRMLRNSSGNFLPQTARLLPPATVDQQKRAEQTPSRSASHAKTSATPQQFHRRSIGDWDFVKTVGAGSMGKVKLAKHRGTNEVCAIKIVPRAARLYARAHVNDAPPATSEEALARKKEYEKELARDRRTIREASLGRILYHPYICRLFEVKVMSNHYYMLFEYVSGGQMLDYIVSHGSLKERHARKFARGIGSALDYLHKNNVVHRDLKIENIMISKSGDIKIIDFGLSNMYSYEALLKTYCGSLYFAAPELLSAHPYIGPEVDVWSFGVVLYVLVCGKVPFDDQSVSVLHEKIKKGKVDYPDSLSQEVVSLLKRMLVVDPNKRAHLSEVLAHPWMTRGYEGPAQSFVPHRQPLSLPVDPEVVQEIVRLEFGQSEEALTTELTQLISSRLYQEATHKWVDLNNSSEAHHEMRIDPTSAFHPLISIYYLVEEMLKRKKTRESIVDIPSAASETIANRQAEAAESQEKVETARASKPLHEEQSQPQQHEMSTPTPPPQLTFPEAAHTSPIHATAPLPMADQNQPQILISNTNGDEVVQQQGKKAEDGKGLNSLLRKFSQRRSHSTRRPAGQGYAHLDDSTQQQQSSLAKTNMEQAALVRRVGSMRLRKTPFDNDDGDKPSVNASKSHNRTVSAYAGQASFTNGDVPPLPTHIAPSSTSTQRKFHPTARAKSVGHRRDTYGTAGDAGSSSNVPPVPSELHDDAFFDDVTLDEYSAHSAADKMTLVNSHASAAPGTSNHLGSELSEQQILQEAASAAPGSMPSIEYPRSMFLKGFFSVQTTSTKPLPVIRADVISVLSKLGVQFTEVRGGFVCIHTPSIKQVSASNVISIDDSAPDEVEEETAAAVKSNKSSGEMISEQPKVFNTDDNSFNESCNDQLSTPSSKTHRRKFSIGGSILGYKRKPSTNALASAMANIPHTPVASSNYGNVLNSPTGHNHSGNGEIDSSASLDSLNGAHGGSDMLISSRIEQSRTRGQTSSTSHENTTDGASPTDANADASAMKAVPSHTASSATRSPLKFEIHIVKVPLVGLFGVHFKKVSGNTWMYKALAGQILSELNL